MCRLRGIKALKSGSLGVKLCLNGEIQEASKDWMIRKKMERNFVENGTLRKDKKNTQKKILK